MGIDCNASIPIQAHTNTSPSQKDSRVSNTTKKLVNLTNMCNELERQPKSNILQLKKSGG